MRTVRSSGAENFLTPVSSHRVRSRDTSSSKSPVLSNMRHQLPSFHISFLHICFQTFANQFCQPGIKKHLTPILAGLLEVNPQKMWTFEKFFNEVSFPPFLETVEEHTAGDQPAGEEEGVRVLHQQVESTAGLPRSHPGVNLFTLLTYQSHSSTNLSYLSISFICQSDKSAQHLEHLQLLLTEQTDVEPGSQILLLNVTFTFSSSM